MGVAFLRRLRHELLLAVLRHVGLVHVGLVLVGKLEHGILRAQLLDRHIERIDGLLDLIGQQLLDFVLGHLLLLCLAHCGPRSGEGLFHFFGDDGLNVRLVLVQGLLQHRLLVVDLVVIQDRTERFMQSAVGAVDRLAHVLRVFGRVAVRHGLIE